MKQLKKTLMSLIVGLCILFTVPSVLPETASIQTVQAASKVKLNKSKSTLIKGQTLQLKLSGTTKKVTWSTSSKSVATVSSKGKVTAKKAGTATITAKAGGKKYNCKVTVESPKISKTSVTLTEKKTATLKVTGTKQTVKWSTKNKSIATVNSKGVVTAKKAGTTTITAAVGGKKYTCKVTVKKKNVAVTKVGLDESALVLIEDDTAILTVTVTPSNATDKSVTWSSSNSAVASVDGGTVKAKSAGAATITAKAGSKKAMCKVTVIEKEIPVTGIVLSKSSLELTENDTAILTATVTPSNTTDKEIIWNSSDDSVAAVNDGRVEANFAGTATITATAGNKKATCKVTVKEKEIAVTGISLDKTALELTEGDTANLIATITPANATDKSVTWSSSDSSVAAVSNGTVTAKSAGTATITATAGNKKATCKVTVKEKEIAVTGISLDKTTLELTEGDTANLIATITPANATNKEVTWESSNTDVITVDSVGNINAKLAGSSVITAHADGKTVSCKVNVVKRIPTVVENYATLANYIKTCGGVNSSGNSFIKCVETDSDGTYTYAIVYDSSNNVFSFITTFDTSMAQNAYEMVVTPEMMTSLNPRFVLVYKDYDLGCEATATLYPATYTQNTDLLFKLESGIGLTQNDIQKIGNSGLRLSFSGWAVLALRSTGMLLSDLGFTAY